MIGVTFQVPDLNFTTSTIPMQLIPQIGHQIFLGDFITEEEENKICSENKNPNIDSLIVKNVTWLRSPRHKEIYVLITLFND